MLHFLFKSTCDVFCTFESHSILRLGFLRTETFWSLYLCVPKADRLNSRRTWEKGQPTIAVPILHTGRPTTFWRDSSEFTWEVHGRATTSVPFGHEVPLGAIQKESPPARGSLSPLHAELWLSEPLCPFVGWALHPGPETAGLVHIRVSHRPQPPAATALIRKQNKAKRTKH